MKQRLQCCLLVAILFSALQLTGQSNDNGAASQLKMLSRFKGYWEAKNATMHSDGKTYTFLYTADFKTTADNHGFIMTEHANIRGMGKLDGTNLVGVNPYDGKVHWFSVDNIDVAHEHIGEFTDSGHFSMVNKSMQNGKEYIETITIEFPDADTLVLHVTTVLDGKEISSIAGTFHLIKAK